MEREKGKWMKTAGGLGRYKYVLLVVALGALLLAWPQRTEDSGGTQVEPAVEQQGELEELETAMEDILGKISGVGRVEVMLTLQSSGRRCWPQTVPFATAAMSRRLMTMTAPQRR